MQVPQRTENEIKIQTLAEKAIDKADSLIINDEATLSLATDILKFIKEKINHADAERKNIVQPFNEGVKAINNRFKFITEPLEKAERDLKAKMLGFQQKLEADRRAAAEEKRRETIEFAKEQAKAAEVAGDAVTAKEINKAVEVAMFKPVEIEKVRTTSGALSTVRKTWNYEVIDIKALANARPDLVVENSAAIRKEFKDGAEIPGLRLFQTESISIR